MGKETMYRKVISTTGSFTYEPVTGHFFTEEEFKKVVGDAWDASRRKAIFDNDADGNPIPDKRTYLDKLLK